jgi:hypothetical protein
MNLNLKVTDSILTLWFSILLRVYYKSPLTSTVRNFSLIYLFYLFYFIYFICVVEVKNKINK